MRLLLNTHIWLWYQQGSDRLSIELQGKIENPKISFAPPRRNNFSYSRRSFWLNLLSKVLTFQKFLPFFDRRSPQPIMDILRFVKKTSRGA